MHSLVSDLCSGSISMQNVPAFWFQTLSQYGSDFELRCPVTFNPPPPDPHVRFLTKQMSWNKRRHIFSMMAGITIILLHFPAVRQLVYCTAMRYHFNLEERKRGGQCGLWCFLLASIVSWELIKMRLLCSCSFSRGPPPPPPPPPPTHSHTIVCFFIGLIIED